MNTRGATGVRRGHLGRLLSGIRLIAAFILIYPEAEHFEAMSHCHTKRFNARVLLKHLETYV